MSTRRALAFSFLDRYSGLLLAIGSSMVIARLLTPAQIGVFSVTMVLLSFISAMRDMGAGQYIVQERELTPNRIRAAWTVQLGLGILFAILILVAAKPVALFYEQPQMFDMMALMALNFAISPFGSLTYATLIRKTSFGKLAVMRFSSGLVGAMASIIMAWHGYGAISLAVGSLSSTVINALLAIIFRPKEYPWLPGGTSEIKRVLSFGSQISFSTIINTITFSSAELSLGKLQTMTDVGLFSRSNGLIGMFNKLVMDAVGSVSLSVFASEARAGVESAPTFLKAIAYITAVGWLFTGILALYADTIIDLLYGPQWLGAVELTRLMSVGMAFGLISSLCPTAITALGEARLTLKTTIATGIVYSILMIIGAWMGLSSIGHYFIAANLVASAIWMRQTSKFLKFSDRELLKILSKSGAVAIAALTPAALIIFFELNSISNEIQLLSAIILSVLAFTVACSYFSHPMNDEARKIRNLFLKSLKSIKGIKFKT